MNWPPQDRWRRIWQAADVSGDDGPWYEKLTLAYAEPQRHYHNQQHIAECLAEFDSARHLIHALTASLPRSRIRSCLPRSAERTF